MRDIRDLERVGFTDTGVSDVRMHFLVTKKKVDYAFALDEKENASDAAPFEFTLFEDKPPAHMPVLRMMSRWPLRIETNHARTMAGLESAYFDVDKIIHGLHERNRSRKPHWLLHSRDRRITATPAFQKEVDEALGLAQSTYRGEDHPLGPTAYRLYWRNLCLFRLLCHNIFDEIDARLFRLMSSGRGARCVEITCIYHDEKKPGVTGPGMSFTLPGPTWDEIVRSITKP
jgi:hypothetical protein